MNEIKVGDIVARKSYGLDVFFKVIDIKKVNKENIVVLKGISYRIEADAPESDLMVQSDQRVKEHNMRQNQIVERKCRSITASRGSVQLKKAFYRDTSKDGARKFSKPGKVLHLDGDNDYMDTCLEEYNKLGIDVVCRYVPEKDQAAAVYKLLQEIKPDILVLTGHDGVIKGNNYGSLENYRNSKYFINAVKEARRYQQDCDSLVIFAGACQSMYNELINAGANFASSPYRVLIHALDPVLICQKIAFGNVDKILDPRNVIENTITGTEGIGGIQTRGKYRDGFPLEPYN